MSEIKNVTITVPVGLNGWQQTGSVVINGMKVEFPVGEETQVPETAAALLNELIEAAEKRAEDTAKPDNHYVGAVTIPAGKNLVLEDGAGIKRGDRVIQPETVMHKTEEDGATFFKTNVKPSALYEHGKGYRISYNGTWYDCVALDAGIVVDGVASGTMWLGNGVAAGAPETPGLNSDAPFFMYAMNGGQVDDEVGTLYAVLMSFDEATSVTLSIVEKGEAVSVGGGKFIVHATDRTYLEVNPFEGVFANTFAVTVDKTLSDVLEAFNNNMDVECREESGGNATIYTLNNIGESGCTFFSLLGEIVNMIYILPDGTAYFCTND